MLANRLIPKYRYEDCAILALDDGSVIVGLQIAKQLHCTLSLLSIAEIRLPQEPIAVAGMANEGAFSYNTSEYSKGDLDELVLENRGYVEQEKLKKMHEINQVIGHVGAVNKQLLRDHNIIVVSDGLKSAFDIDIVYEFLKPVKLNKLVFAIALASVPVVDKMHVLGDELYCLDVVEDYIGTNHYYDDNNLPEHEDIIKLIKEVILKWQ
ncbi:MAG TPA: hypothetical protein VLF63_02435 [Patescibacteria group bacterium]|nr:hypothetical protein [Patescibacteria group bacterium]